MLVYKPRNQMLVIGALYRAPIDDLVKDEVAVNDVTVKGFDPDRIRSATPLDPVLQELGTVHSGWMA